MWKKRLLAFLFLICEKNDCNTSYATRNFFGLQVALKWQLFPGGYLFSFSTQVIRKVLRDEYADEFERGQVEVEKIYVELCLDLVAKIPEHGFDLSRLERAEATASEAQEKLTEAIELNKTRESNLKKWLSEARNVRTISAPFFFPGR